MSPLHPHQPWRLPKPPLRGQSLYTKLHAAATLFFVDVRRCTTRLHHEEGGQAWHLAQPATSTPMHTPAHHRTLHTTHHQEWHHEVAPPGKGTFSVSIFFRERRLWTCFTDELFSVLSRADVLALPLSYPAQQSQRGPSMASGLAGNLYSNAHSRTRPYAAHHPPPGVAATYRRLSPNATHHATHDHSGTNPSPPFTQCHPPCHPCPQWHQPIPAFHSMPPTMPPMSTYFRSNFCNTTSSARQTAPEEAQPSANNSETEGDGEGFWSFLWRSNRHGRSERVG